ncbi:MAG: hypothetical protein IPN97_16085 [Saprospiraceae bacterium]|nr:hypothetical protein [Saprospiraceae bacterium]
MFLFWTVSGFQVRPDGSFTDGTTHYTISSLNACAYPSLASVGISGPRSLCTADDATYSISAPLGNTDDLFWTVVGGKIINGQEQLLYL